MHVLRCVFKQTMASVVVLDVVQGHRLEPTPAEGHDEGISSLQDALVPTMFLQPHLNGQQESALHCGYVVQNYVKTFV